METKEIGCCNTKGSDKGNCGSKIKCSPCLFVWGVFLLVIILSYFIR